MELKTAFEIAQENAQVDKEKYITEHKTEIKDDDLTPYKKPSKRCKKCFDGRGYMAWNTTTRMPILCTCLTRQVDPYDTNPLNKALTYGELKEIIKNATPKSQNVEVRKLRIRPKSLRRSLTDKQKDAYRFRLADEIIKRSQELTEERLSQNGNKEEVALQEGSTSNDGPSGQV